jgi:GT2 family glycosyltransferase
VITNEQTYVDVLPRIGVLILNCNGKKWLEQLYENLRTNVYPNNCIYLVDNASDDGSVELTLERYPEVTVIRMPQNLGYCMAYNLAMPYAFRDGCDWVIWANNDIKLEPGCLNELARVSQSDPQIGMLGPAFLAWESDDPNYYMVGNHPYAITAMKSQSCEPIDVEWVEGSFLMVSRRCVEAVGPLDPYLFFYWEETDFCRRARYQGWRVILAPKALARHYARGSTNQQNRALVSMFQSRNYYIFKLTNPFQSFVRNFMDAIHVLLVNGKTHLRSRPSAILLEISAFARVLRDIQIIHQKWRRDRVGDHPMATMPGLESIRVKVLSSQGGLAPKAN